ncbi:MAG: hypothetical protein IJP23_00705, partial [Oscillospiraceae bacterium]|nr:hypothetical protein [Oscillospiraceae bacterium]
GGVVVRVFSTAPLDKIRTNDILKPSKRRASAMYNNVGKKIKALVKAVAILASAIFVVAGFVLILIDQEFALYGFLLMTLCPALIVIFSYYAYGFGEIVDTAIYLREGGTAPVSPSEAPATPTPQPADSQITGATSAPQPAQPAQPEVDITPYLGKKFCSGCGEFIADSNVTECPVCGSKYLGTITHTNAANIIPNIVKH